MESVGQPVEAISPQLALALYMEGARHWRRPKVMPGPTGLDTNSLDFRGARAAARVLEAFPHPTDPADGCRLPDDPKIFADHFSGAFAQIAAAGDRKLAGDFVVGYDRVVAALVKEAVEISVAPVLTETSE